MKKFILILILLSAALIFDASAGEIVPDSEAINTTISDNRALPAQESNSEVLHLSESGSEEVQVSGPNSNPIADTETQSPQEWSPPTYVERPRVGLVLSGGGAKGVAHIPMECRSTTLPAQVWEQ